MHVGQSAATTALPDPQAGVRVCYRGRHATRGLRIALAAIFLALCVWLSPAEPQINKSRDFYRILGVKRDATEKEIKSAYRAKSRVLHPDINPEGGKKFIDVRDAHEVLTNAESRALYDKYGEAGLDPNFHPQQGGDSFQQAFNTRDGRTFVFAGGNPFEAFFGPGSGFAGNRDRPFHFSFNREEARRMRPVARPLYEDESSGVVHVTVNNWASVVRDRDFVALVNFYNPRCQGCVAFESAYERLAATLKDVMTVAVVDCDRSGELCRAERVEGVPNLRLYTTKGAPLQFMGPLRQTPLFEWLSQNIAIPGTILTSSNFEGWLTASPPALPKVLFVTKKTHVPLFVRAVAHEFRTLISFGLVLGTPEGRKLVVKTFPSWRDAMGISASSSVPDGSQALAALPPPVPLPAIFHLVDIDTLRGEWLQFKSKSRQMSSLMLSRLVAQKRAQFGAYEPQKAADGLPLLPQLTKRVFVGGECRRDDSAICVILFTHPEYHHSTDSTERVLRRIRSKYSRDPLKFFRMDDSKKGTFVHAFGEVKSFPSLVAYRPRRGKYKVLEVATISSVSLGEQVEGFLDSVLSGCAMPHRVLRHPSVP